MGKVVLEDRRKIIYGHSKKSRISKGKHLKVIKHIAQGLQKMDSIVGHMGKDALEHLNTCAPIWRICS